MIGDSVLLQFMLENLINEALTYQEEGELELHIYQEGRFVRFDFIDRRRHFEQEELNQLFYPHLSRMKQSREEVLTGTEYLICKQIIRDHDEFAGRRGCRINACQAPDGGFMVWFTIPCI
jgi:K+-sensing histidine kinase KdpD